MSAFDTLADRIAHFKRTGPSTGIGSCPTAVHLHGDRSRGLSLRATEDRCLVFCHAGCGAGDIVAALGLTLGDLYDRPLGQHFAPCHSRIPARDILAVIDEELLTAVIILDGIMARHAVSPAEIERLAQAAGRIGRARDQVHG